MESDAQTGEIEHRQVVGAVADGYRLGDVDLLELAEQAQQLGFAAAVHHLAHVAAREFALLDFQLVGIYVVESVFLAQVVAEVGEAARQNGRLVTHALEDGHHALQPFGDGQAAGDLLHNRDVETLEQGHAARETLAEVDFAAHGAGRDRPHLVADSGAFGQFVDHLGLNQRRIHVEADQAAAAAVDVVFLERNVEPDLRQIHEPLLHRAALLVGERPAHRKFDARFGRTVVLAERDAARQALYGVDIQPVLCHHACHFGDMACRDRTSQEGDDIAVLALPADPVVVVLFRNGSETDHHAQLRCLEQQLLHDVARLVRRGLEQDAQRQRLVDVGLAYVEDEGVVAREYFGERRGHSRLVFA